MFHNTKQNDADRRMKNTISSEKTSLSISQLDRARTLDLPSRQEMLQRAPSVQAFWNSNRDLLTDAWKEWEEHTKSQLVMPDDSLLDQELRRYVTRAWKEPTTESDVRNLWTEVSPGVFKAQFFNPERLKDLRQYLEAAANANIPLRPPYGIVLNRRGAMLDPRSEGFLAAPAFQLFYRQLMDKYMRPIARLLFPEVMGYDSQTFGFSIQYQSDMDTSLRPHTDASAATMNINLNLPNEEFEGSEVDFYNAETGKNVQLVFEPGVAVIHRGNAMHAARPITKGERSNIVLWLYGDRMQIPNPNNRVVGDTAEQRWKLPSAEQDDFAPF